SVLAREADDGRIENVFMLQIMNTEERTHRYRITVDGLPGAEIAGDAEVDAGAAALTSFNTVVRVPPEAGKSGSNPIHFEITALENAAIKVREKATFLLP
ncbi:MAG: FixG Ig-like domain-containing protein, partial [Betaproteobacteria bacterium]